MPDIWKYDVFKLAGRLVLDVHKLTNHIPDDKLFGLTTERDGTARAIRGEPWR
jgi:hypothetical protein